MAAAPVTIELAHAIDAPFDTFDEWFDTLEFGVCTACGSEAYAGRTGWWHEGARVCPDRANPLRRLGFSPDPADDLNEE